MSNLDKVIGKGKSVAVNVECNKEQLQQYLLDIYNAVEANNLVAVDLELLALNSNKYCIKYYLVLKA